MSYRDDAIRIFGASGHAVGIVAFPVDGFDPSEIPEYAASLSAPPSTREAVDDLYGLLADYPTRFLYVAAFDRADTFPEPYNEFTGTSASSASDAEFEVTRSGDAEITITHKSEPPAAPETSDSIGIVIAALIAIGILLLARQS